MIVATRDGRHHSKVTRNERLQKFLKKWETLSEPEREAVTELVNEIRTLNEEGTTGFEDLNELLGTHPSYNEIAENHYVGNIISIDEFVKDDYYLGVTGNDLYPKWLADLKEFYKGQYTEAIISGSLGSGKCLAGETEFYDPETGLRSRLDESGTVSVPAFNFETGSVDCARATVKQTGHKKLGVLHLASGKKERLSPDHPILFSDGWGEVGSANPGDLVATVRSLPEPLNPLEIPDEVVEFIAFMLAEGGCSGDSWTFCNENNACIGRFVQVSESLWMQTKNGGPVGVSQREKRPGKARVFYPRGTKRYKHRYGLYSTSHHKRIPDSYFGLSNRQLALFLNRIWACDGWLTLPSEKIAPKIEITLASEFFIKDIQQVLLRFGIHSRTKKQQKSYTYNGEKRWRWSWRLSVTGVENIGKFVSSIGQILSKERLTREMSEWVDKTKGNTNVDITPIDSEMLSEYRKEVGPVSRDQWWPSCPRGQLLGRNNLLKLKEVYGLPENWEWWTDVFWDEVKSYEVGKITEPIYDVEVPGYGNFAPGGIIVHNTSWAEFALLRMFYELTMLKDPQSTFGLMPGSEILLVCFNRDDSLARKVTYGGVKVKLEQSSYFKDIGCKIGKSETIYPTNNISIIAVSARSAKALGRNVFGGIIDEADFLEGSSFSGKERAIAPGEKPFAERLHSSILRRMKSRYDRAGVMPGKIIMSSSAKNVDSFTNKRIGLAINDPSVFCRDYAIYDVKPAHHFSPVRFWVLVGNAQIRHQILTDEEYEGLGKAGRAKKEREGCKFIHVPDNFRADFERNIEDSIRDIGGIVTISVSIFIQLRDKIYEAIDPGLKHPVKTEVWVTDKPPPIDWSMLCHKVEKRLELGYRETSLEPIRHPEAMRHVHIDLSLGRQDAAGLCIAHVVDVIDVERRGADGHVYVEPAPLIEVDLLLRIEAPRNGEIDIGSVRGLVYHFMDHGFSFGFASMDSFQSAESLQKFRQQGIAAEVISVDSKYDPYDYLKLALYEGRVSYYRYPWLLKELEKLERDLTKGMIIHPASGSKDIGDSLAGCCYSLSTKVKHRAPIDIGISEYEGAEKDDEWIRQTMVHKGDRAPRQVGRFPGKNPLISME